MGAGAAPHARPLAFALLQGGGGVGSPGPSEMTLPQRLSAPVPALHLPSKPARPLRPHALQDEGIAHS